MTSLLARLKAWVLAVPALLIALAVFGAATIERDTAIHAGQQQQESQRMLTAMLDQETGARGYLQNRDQVFLQPWNLGTAAFPVALAASRTLAVGDAALQQSLSDQARRAVAWHASVAAEISQLRTTGFGPPEAASLADKSLMDEFRAANASFAAVLNQRRDKSLSLATAFAVLVAVVLSLVLLLVGLGVLRRATRLEAERVRQQTELRELLQVAESEDESRMLLIRHVEKTLPGAGAAVLNRNNSEDRLQPFLGSRAAETPLNEVANGQFRPRSCLAVRLSRSHERGAGDDPLLRCEVCGAIEGNVACEPLIVGGQVIGAVLVAREKALSPRELGRMRESVLQAAPILANQRNLALAETRAAHDALTGLPNRRTADETLKRMAAHAGRTASPLAAVLIDLDKFKQINDLHGHDQGDQALATVGQILNSTLRASDFVARYGGEEFLLLLPDTDRQGALAAAEKLRQAIEHAETSQVSSLSASFGVAILPDDAVDTELLIRMADRALYAAKEGGRNRVETAAPSPAG